MRRPPDKDAHPGMSERDVESSNATLNTLFGGASRQKAWLLGHRAPVRPTPRPSLSKGSGSTAPLVQNNAPAVLPSPAPSDEPSPILHHNTISEGVQNQNQRQTYDNENQRPGGTAGQRPTTRPSETVTRPSIQQTNPRVLQSIPQVRANRPSPVSTNTRPTVLASSVLASPSATTGQRLAEGQATFRSIAEFQSPSLPPPNPISDQTFSSPRQSISRSAANDTHQQRADVQQAPRDQLLSPSPVSSPPPEMAFDQPPLPASVLLPRQNQARASPSSIQLNPHKRQRVHVSVPSLKGRVALINAHVECVGGTHYLNSDLERPRFQLLSEACSAEDTFYVALHQLFCIWDSPKRGLLASIPEFPPLQGLAISFKVLGNLIRENKGLASNHLKWFIDFPSPLPDLMRSSEAYQNIVRNVGEFLGKLASDWAPFSRLCSARGYPPLVDELIQRMGLTSPILQHIMFTAARRNLGIDDDQYGEQMEKVFVEDKQGHQALAARFNTGRPPTEKEIIERNQTLRDKYLAINNHRIRSIRVSGPVAGVGSPLANSPLAPQQANIQHPASTSSNDASIASRPQTFPPNSVQSFPSPDVWHQVMQQHGVMSNPSPISPVQAVAGRPLSGSGFQTYSSAPSLTLLQGLSMNSPVVESPGLQQEGVRWTPPAPVLRSNGYEAQNFVAIEQNGRAPAAPQQHQQQILIQQQQQQHQQLAAQQAAAQQHQQLSMLQQQQQIAAQQQRQLAMQAQSQQQLNPQMHQQIRPQIRQQAQPQMQPQGQQAQHRPAQHSPRTTHPRAAQYIQQAQHRQSLQQQHQQLDQQLQHMTTAAQQVLSMNRAAQLRSSSDPVDVQQRVHSRNNSISSVGRTPTTGNSPNPALPRPLPPFIPSPAAQNHAILAYTNTLPLERSLVPPTGFQQPAQAFHADMTALHQAHIRSPHLVAAEILPSQVPEDDPSRRFYQFVKNLAMPPTKISVTSSMSYLDFYITEESFGLIARDRRIGNEHLPVREFKRGSLQYRLRCIQSKRDTSQCLMPEWVISDTVWPETVFVEINSHQLEVRRKNHHGKDLPIDVTRYVVPKLSPENVNRIKISIPRLRKVMKDNSYFVAVEVVEVLQHSDIMEMCTQNQHIPASRTLDAIKKSLAPSQTDDDDFAIAIGDLSIDLADPFSTRIFDIPVRGNSCLHRECFDLEIFLLSRNSKPKRPNQPSMIDVWKCPLCGKDARPYSLQVDDFLVGVRAELAAQDNLETKAILISADGSWRAKPEPRSMKRKATDGLDDDDPDSSDGEGSARRQQAIGRRNNPDLNGNGSGRASKEIEVIELDD